MKTIVGIVILVVATYGVFKLNEATKDEDGKSMLHVAEDPKVLVEVAVPEQRLIVRTVQAPGTVEPILEVDISAEVPGKIVEMPIEEGDTVKAGDLLCRLDDTSYRALVLVAKASVARLRAAITLVEAEFDKADRDLQRQIKLSEANATSSTELADYQTAHIRAKASVEMRKQDLIEAQARLQSANENLAKTVIEAPIDGIVAQLFAKKGEVVITGTMNNPGTRVMVISDLSKMQVRCRVDETDAALVRAGQSARIYLQSDSRNSIPGHVFRVGIKGTKPQGRDVVTFETLVLVDRLDEMVKAGMTANIEIEVAHKDNALTVPVEAIVFRKRKDLPEELLAAYDEQHADDEGDSVKRRAEYIKLAFAVVDGVARARFVETDISDATGVEIVRGIEAGDQVVIGPYRSLDQLKDGDKVKLPEKKKETQEDKDEDAAQPEPGGDEPGTAVAETDSESTSPVASKNE